MDSHDRAFERPGYNVAPGQPELTMEPPFVFPGVTMRVFPVKANMFQLAAFCDRYLNIVPRDVGVFRPASPMVVFAMINYGRMGSAISNLGWVSQNEVVFSVFLEWYKEDPQTGRLEFHDWATVTPFLFVDSQTSLATGREVYGWPKVLAALEAEISPWTKSPRRHRRLMRLSTMLFKDAFAGQEQVLAPLIEIDQLPPPTLTELPPRWDNPFNPLYSLPFAARGLARMGQDFLEMALRPPLQGYGPPIDPGSAAAMMRRALGYANPLAPDLSNNTINLKQFRDACHPDEFAYQALTLSKMTTERFNHIGLLGDTTLMRGDPSCGYRIRVHRYDSQPIVDSLGLEVAEVQEEAGVPVDVLKPFTPFWLDQDIIYGGGQTIAWRTQWIPWTRPGENPDCCRNEELPREQRLYNTTRSGALQEISGPFHLPNTTVRVLPLLADRKRLDRFCQAYLDDPMKIGRLFSGEFEPNAYEVAIEALGSYVYFMIANFEEQSSETANIGRFTDRESSFVFPVKLYNAFKLWAGAQEKWEQRERQLRRDLKLKQLMEQDRKILRKVCEGKEPSAREVADLGVEQQRKAMAIHNQLSQGEQVSRAEVDQWLDEMILGLLRKVWAGKKLDPEERLSLRPLAEPLLAELRRQGREDLRPVRAEALYTLGLVAPFRYAASNLAAISDREILGWTTVQADILSPEGAWLASSGPASDVRGLAEIRTDVLPALNMGQQIERRTLIQVVKGTTPVPRASWHDEWRLIASRWAPVLKDDFDRKMRTAGLSDHGAKEGEGDGKARRQRQESFAMMKAMALHLLTQREPINTFSLKQFRDLREPEKACYQALVHDQTKIESVHTLEEIEDPLHLGIHRFPSQDIVGTLGLAVKYEDLSGSEPVAWIEPIRPFWAKLDFRTERPQEALYRVSAKNWLVAPGLDPRWFFGPRQRAYSAPEAPLAEDVVKTVEEQEFDLWEELQSPHADQISQASFVVSVMMGILDHLHDPSLKQEERDEIKQAIRAQLMRAMLDLEIEEGGLDFDTFWVQLRENKLWLDGKLRMKRQYLPEATRFWKTDPPRLDITRAARAVEEIDDLQTVIESILSREWLNWGSPRWARALERLQNLRELGELDLGAAEEAYEGDDPAAWAQKTYEQINDSLLEVLRSQKPQFYLRADSLGPGGHAYRRQWDMAADFDEQYWYAAARIDPRRRMERSEKRKPAKHPDFEQKLTRKKRGLESEKAKLYRSLKAILEAEKKETRKAVKKTVRTAKKSAGKKKTAGKKKSGARKGAAKKKTAGKKTAGRRTTSKKKSAARSRPES